MDYRTSVVSWLLRHFDTQHADIPSWYAGLDAQDQTRAVIDSLFKLNEDNVVIPKFRAGETFKCIIELKKKSQVKRVPTPTDPVPQGVPTPADPVLQGVPTYADLVSQGVPTPTDPVLQGVPTPADPVLQGVPTPADLVSQGVPTPTDLVLQRVPTPTDLVSQGVPTPTDLVLQRVPTPTDPTPQRVPTPTDPRLKRVPTPTDPRLKRVPTLTDTKSMMITGDQVMDVVDNTNEVHEIVDSSPGDEVAGLAEHRPQSRSGADGGFLVKFQKFDRTSILYPFAIRVRSSKLELLSLIRNEVYQGRLARELSACMIDKLSLDHLFVRGHMTQPLVDHFVQTLKNNLPLLLVDMNYETDAAVWSLYIGAFRFTLTYVEGNEPVINTESRTIFNYSHA